MNKIIRAKGRLGIMIAGLGSVATTFIASVEAIKKGLAIPAGSLTQTGMIKVHRRDSFTYLKLKDYVSLANVKDKVFGGWDVYSNNLYQQSEKTLEPLLRKQIKTELQSIVPLKAVVHEESFSHENEYVKQAKNIFELAKLLMYDIANFCAVNNCSRPVIMWCGPKEPFKASKSLNAIEDFEEALYNNDRSLSPSMIYAYAALSLGVPFVNGSGNEACNIVALTELALISNSPVCGKNFKSQHFLQMQPFFPRRYSHFREDENSSFARADHTGQQKKAALNVHAIQSSQRLCTDVSSAIRLSYSPELNLNPLIDTLHSSFMFSSVIILDVILFIDLAKRAYMRGIQEWLSFYFISPLTYPGLPAERNAYKQLKNLGNTIYYLKNKDIKVHDDLDYYE